GVGIALQSLQVGTHVGGDLIAQVSVFLQCLADDVFQLGRQVRIQAHSRRWCPVENGFEDHSRSVTPKRKHTRTHLVQNCAEREQVSASIKFLATHLLWRHVSNGSKRRTWTG